MADGATTRHALLLMETGTHDNVWGVDLNTVIQNIENSARGVRSTATTGGTTTLTTTTSREPIQVVTGALISNAIIEVPAASTSWWLFKNETTGAFTLTVKVTGQTGVAVPQGTTVGLRCNGTDVVNVGLAVSAVAASDTVSGIVELDTDAEAIAGTDTTRAMTAANVKAALNNKPESFLIAVSDETTAITTGNAKVTFRMPYAFTLTSVKSSLTTASSSGLPTVDINEGGVSVLSTTLSIDANELTSATAATAAVISDAALAADASITIDIDTAGTGAKGLKVYLIGHQ